MTLQKETLGPVTTNIKAGGKIHGVVCYKYYYWSDEYCDAISDVLEFGWAAETDAPDNGGNTDSSENWGDRDNNNDSSSKMSDEEVEF